MKADALLHSEALVLCASRTAGLPLDDRLAFIRAALALAVQFNDAAAQGRALIAAAETHLDALEHSVFAIGAAGFGDDIPYFCQVPASADDAMARACAAVALGCTALHNARCAEYGAENGLRAQELQADYAEAIVLASLAFKEAGAYVCARTIAARAMEECGGFIKSQLKARCATSDSKSPRQSHHTMHAYILVNFKRVKFYSSCKLLNVSAAAAYAHACILQDCNLHADAIQQFDCCATLFSFLAQPSLLAASLLHAAECESATVGEGGGYAAMLCFAVSLIHAFIYPPSTERKSLFLQAMRSRMTCHVLLRCCSRARQRLIGYPARCISQFIYA